MTTPAEYPQNTDERLVKDYCKCIACPVRKICEEIHSRTASQPDILDLLDMLEKYFIKEAIFEADKSKIQYQSKYMHCANMICLCKTPEGIIKFHQQLEHP